MSVICYAVVFMNYYPLEVDSLWETREGAEAHIGTLTNPSNWDICEMEIRHGLEPQKVWA